MSHRQSLPGEAVKNEEHVIMPLRYASAFTDNRGSTTFSQMREEVLKGDLYNHGDTVLVWVNESDLAWHSSGQCTSSAAETITTLKAKIAGLEGDKDALIEINNSNREDHHAEMKRVDGLLNALQARCEAAEQALEGMRTEVTAKLTAAESLMLASGWWFNKAGYMTDAALWIEQALLALNPTPQGGKPDSEPTS